MGQYGDACCDPRRCPFGRWVELRSPSSCPTAVWMPPSSANQRVRIARSATVWPHGANNQSSWSFRSLGGRLPRRGRCSRRNESPSRRTTFATRSNFRALGRARRGVMQCTSCHCSINNPAFCEPTLRSKPGHLGSLSRGGSRRGSTSSSPVISSPRGMLRGALSHGTSMARCGGVMTATIQTMATTGSYREANTPG